MSLAFVAVFPTIGPETTYTATELACLRENAAAEGESASGALDPGESSTASHFRALRDGIRTVAEHPWGFGLGNAGVSASRTGAEVKAGESTYTELGVDTGVLGLAAFVGWLVALALALRRPLAVARGLAGRRRRARAADRRDRGPLARGRRLRARGLGAARRSGRAAAGGRGVRPGPSQPPEPNERRRATSAGSTIWPSRPT